MVIFMDGLVLLGNDEFIITTAPLTLPWVWARYRPLTTSSNPKMVSGGLFHRRNKAKVENCGSGYKLPLSGKVAAAGVP